MRLRPLTEAECYARCYGGRTEELVSLLRPDPSGDPPGAEPQPLADPPGPDPAEAREAA